MAKLIKLTFRKAGVTSVEGINFVGPECNEKMRPIEQALGGVQTREDKPEINMLTEDRQTEEHLEL